MKGTKGTKGIQGTKGIKAGIVIVCSIFLSMNGNDLAYAFAYSGFGFSGCPQCSRNIQEIENIDNIEMNGNPATIVQEQRIIQEQRDVRKRIKSFKSRNNPPNAQFQEESYQFQRNHPRNHQKNRGKLKRSTMMYPRRSEVIILEPQIKIREPVPMPYPRDVIRPFLKNIMMFCTKGPLACAPRVIALDKQHAVAGKGDFIYVRGIKCNGEGERVFNVYRPGRTYYHPHTREYLGYEGEIVGTAELTIPGRVAELKLLEATEGVEIGARLLPTDAAPPIRDLYPAPATIPIEGFVLSIKDAKYFGGKNQVLVVSLGEREGVQEGDLFDIYKADRKRTICDFCGCRTKLPAIRIARVLVYRVFWKLSLVLVIDAEEVINLLDRVRSP